MKKFLPLLFIAVTLLASEANKEKRLAVHKIDSKISIDGIIDPLWAQADSISDFVQHDPYPNTKPSRKTVAKILTNDESLYCLILCYDNFNDIEKITGKLDDFGGDGVSLMIDTFGDKRTAYKFAVSSTGVKADSRLLDDARNRDYNWDGIWFAASKIYDWGYAVEIEVPYKSIQYEESLSEWGLDFDRWIPHLTEDIYWCSYEENEGQRISKFGTLNFNGFKPSVHGLNLEIYPVGISKISYLGDGKYEFKPNAGLDIFYNPSQKLTFQLTANPDFAQIEADPFDFNISRYESYFSERRPFFIEGQEIFQAAGRQRNTGFYRPLEFFYPRRIGKKLPDGSEVPLNIGAKAFGRLGEWEYGSFIARTGETNYSVDGTDYTEKAAVFATGRVKKQIMENSSIGVLFSGKHEEGNNYGVLDIDGAFRGSNWQLAYQAARSFKNSEGDYAFSAGFTHFKQNWMNLARARYIGENFDVDQIGFVPWRGSWELVGITGPRWYFEKGYVNSIMVYGGIGLGWQVEDHYTDRIGILGYNMNFRNNWGGEINLSFGKSRDLDVDYSSYDISFSSWFHTSPNWNGNLWGGYSKTYNFSRDYLAFYSRVGGRFSFKLTDILSAGSSLNLYFEGNPDGNVEDAFYNARPYFSLTPVNDLNVRVYVDNLFIKSTNKMQQVIFGFLFSYNFSPKSWIYFAINDLYDRSNEYDAQSKLLPNRMHLRTRAGVAKVSYLYYF